jgi:hypothetical protein
VEQHQGYRIDLAARPDVSRERPNLGLVEPLDGLAQRPDALVDLERMPPLYGRLRFTQARS